jgi:hypothetical protein
MSLAGFRSDHDSRLDLDSPDSMLRQAYLYIGRLPADWSGRSETRDNRASIAHKEKDGYASQTAKFAPGGR